MTEDQTIDAEFVEEIPPEQEKLFGAEGSAPEFPLPDDEGAGLPALAYSRHTRQLPVDLTDEQKQVYGAELAALEVELAELRAEARISAADYKSDIKAKAEVVAGLARKLHAGIDTGAVECYWIENEEKRVMELFRVDSDQCIDSRPIRPEDRQTSFI